MAAAGDTRYRVRNQRTTPWYRLVEFNFGEVKVNEIATAALRVLGERGFHNTRMADIAAAAGIGEPPP